MGPIPCPEMSVNNYRTTPCNIAEKRRSQHFSCSSMLRLDTTRLAVSPLLAIFADVLFSDLCVTCHFFNHVDVVKSSLFCQPEFQKDLQVCRYGACVGCGTTLVIFGQTDKAQWAGAVLWWKNQLTVCPFWSHFATHLPLDITELLLRNVGFTVCPCVCPLCVLLVDRCSNSQLPRLKSRDVWT
jgi:hypothetical protein